MNGWSLSNWAAASTSAASITDHPFIGESARPSRSQPELATVLAEGLPAGLMAILPAVIRVPAAEVARWLPPLLEMLRDATEDARPGAAAVFAKLADVFVAQALRSYLLIPRAGEPVELSHLSDPAIARAVNLLLSRLSETWSVASIAHAVGLSRTTFSSRFRALVGQPPIRYLTRVRMRRAADYLATTEHNLHAIARRTGYDDEASLSRAFKREFGISPGDYRRESATRPLVVEGSASSDRAATS